MATDCDVLNMGLCDHHKNRMAQGPVQTLCPYGFFGQSPSVAPNCLPRIKSKGLRMAPKAFSAWSNHFRLIVSQSQSICCSGHSLQLPVPVPMVSSFNVLLPFSFSLSLFFFKGMPLPYAKGLAQMSPSRWTLPWLTGYLSLLCSQNF